AKRLTPKVVMEILVKIGVECVNDLDQEQRRKFVDELRRETSKLSDTGTEEIPF
ncbi:hypothetical protein LCGC14_1391280, partial [marine sediment metagenome]